MVPLNAQSGRDAGEALRHDISRPAVPAGALVFAAFFFYAVFFLSAYGHRLNYEYVYGCAGAFAQRKEPWIVVSFIVSAAFIAWISFNFFFTTPAPRPGLPRIFFIALSLRLVPAMITFGAGTDMSTFEFVQRAAVSGEWKLYMEHAPYFPFYSYILHGLGVIDRLIPLPEYFLIKLVPVVFDSIMVVPVYILTGKRTYADKYAWNPVTIMVCAVHGQFDSLTIFFTMLALFFTAYKRCPLAAGLSFGTAFQSKWWPAMLVPALFFRMRLREIFVFLFSWLAVFLAFSFPYLKLDPGLLAKPFSYLGVPVDYGITGVAHYMILDLLHLKEVVFDITLGAVRLVCAAAVAWSLFVSRKWDLAGSIAFTILTFYIFCPGWSVQYYSWLAALMFLKGLHRSRLYAAFAIFVFLVYFLVVVFDFGTMTRINDRDIRNVLAFGSMCIVLASIPLWLSLLKKRGNAPA